MHNLVMRRGMMVMVVVMALMVVVIVVAEMVMVLELDFVHIKKVYLPIQCSP